MPIEHEKDDGTKVQAFLPEEVETAKNEAVTAATAAKEEEFKKLSEDLAKAQKLVVDKTENFKKFRDLTEDEKKTYDTNTLEMMKRADKLEEDLTTERTTREGREKADRDANKTKALASIHMDKADVKKIVEDNYAVLAGMPETTVEEINARAAAAARMGGIVLDTANPLYQTFTGEAPQYDPNKQYVDTPQGKEASDLVRQAMGLPPVK